MVLPLLYSNYFYRLSASFYEATCRYGNAKGAKADNKPCNWFKQMACRFAADADGLAPPHNADVDITVDSNWTIAGDFDSAMVAPDDDAVLDGSSSGGGSGDGGADRRR